MKHVHPKYKLSKSPQCSCGKDIHIWEHILRQCLLFADQTKGMWSVLTNIKGVMYDKREQMKKIDVAGWQWRQELTQRRKQRDALINLLKWPLCITCCYDRYALLVVMTAMRYWLLTPLCITCCYDRYALLVVSTDMYYLLLWPLCITCCYELCVLLVVMTDMYYLLLWPLCITCC